MARNSIPSKHLPCCFVFCFWHLLKTFGAPTDPGAAGSSTIQVAPEPAGKLQFILQLSSNGHGSRPRTPSEHSNPHYNRLKGWCTYPKMVALVLNHGQIRLWEARFTCHLALSEHASGGAAHRSLSTKRRSNLAELNQLAIGHAPALCTSELPSQWLRADLSERWACAWFAEAFPPHAVSLVQEIELLRPASMLQMLPCSWMSHQTTFRWLHALPTLHRMRRTRLCRDSP